MFSPPTIVFGLCALVSSGQNAGGEPSGGASASHGFLVLVLGLGLLFGLVLVFVFVLVEAEVLLFVMVLVKVLVEVKAGGAWIELTGLLVEGKGDDDWIRSLSEILD